MSNELQAVAELFGIVRGRASFSATRPLHRPAALTGDPADLLNPADLDELLASRSIRAADLRVALQDRVVAPVEYSVAAETAAGTTSDYVVAQQVYGLVDAGATLIWPHLNRFQPRLARLADAVSAEVGSPCWVDGCLTPGGSAEPAVHDRPVYMLVVQVAGRRRWRVWPTTPHHSAEYRLPRADTLGQPELDVELVAGDVLHIPANSPYASSTGSELSLHASITFHHRSWRDLLLETVLALLETPDFSDRPVMSRATEIPDLQEFSKHRTNLLAAIAELDLRDEIARLRDSGTQKSPAAMAVGSSSEDGHFNRLATADLLEGSSNVEVDARCSFDDDGESISVAEKVYRLPGLLYTTLSKLRVLDQPVKVATILEELGTDSLDIARKLVRLGIVSLSEAGANEL